MPTLEFLRWNSNVVATCPSRSPWRPQMATSHGFFCRHGDLMATKWRPFPRWNSYVGIPMWSPFASVGRHGDLKWRPSDALQFPLSPWRPCGDFSCSNSENALFHLFVSLFAPNSSSSSQMPLNLIKPETLDFTTLNTGKCPRIKHKETGMRAKIIPILVRSKPRLSLT
jgi:hypothetical protein